MRYFWLALSVLLLLPVSGSAQQYITPPQAVQSVRQFMNAPTLPVSVSWFSPNHNPYYLGISAVPVCTTALMPMMAVMPHSTCMRLMA